MNVKAIGVYFSGVRIGGKLLDGFSGEDTIKSHLGDDVKVISLGAAGEFMIQHRDPNMVGELIKRMEQLQ